MTTASAQVSWVGTLRDAWPAARTIRVSVGDAWYQAHSTNWVAASEPWGDGSCAWRVGYTYDMVWVAEQWHVVVGAHEVEAAKDMWACATELQGSLDGVSVGVIDRECWTNAASDADDDGVSAGRYDCDDTDPSRNACVEDVLVDGIDQDCDGEDGDADGDGYASLEEGGPDCDDIADRDGWSGCDGDCDDTLADR